MAESNLGSARMYRHPARRSAVAADHGRRSHVPPNRRGVGRHDQGQAADRRFHQRTAHFHPVDLVAVPGRA